LREGRGADHYGATALDNALMESTVGLYKTEVIAQNPRSWQNLREVEQATAEWVHWFNAARLHSSIGMVSPAEYEASYLADTALRSGAAA
jgi:putative transposase